MGAAATDHLTQGEHGILIGLVRSEVTATPLAEVTANKKGLDMGLLKLARDLSKQPFFS
jgi:6-phosphofructokinase 1